ncbi:MAG: histidinol-phosphate transaminase [Desulfobulbus propionicus]|nr:MAG: histidinol-phosphate transaminase [Desulfobulbus propionicus]
MKILPPENITAITPYPPGKPLDELEREYGITHSIKLASNENPWGPSPNAVAAASKALSDVHRYPDGSGYYLIQALSAWTGAEPDEIVLGNGSNELIEFLIKSYVQPGDEVITSHPSFLMYQKFVQVRGGVNRIIELNRLQHDLESIKANVNDKTRLIFLDNPNNPTGTLIPGAVFDAFLRALPETVIVVLDEAYVDFTRPENRIVFQEYIRKPQGLAGLVFLRTFSKAFGLAGLRIGYGIMHPDISECLHKVRQPFNINVPAQAGALAALQDQEHYTMTLKKTSKGMSWLTDEVKKLGCNPFPSHANFFLLDVKGDATALYEAMLYKGVIVRSMKAYGFPDCIRVTVGTKEENIRFIRTLSECLTELNYG